jgi:hypothetical protein
VVGRDRLDDVDQAARLDVGGPRLLVQPRVLQRGEPLEGELSHLEGELSHLEGELSHLEGELSHLEGRLSISPAALCRRAWTASPLPGPETTVFGC